MFLNLLKERNPEFIKKVVELHQNLKIPSNCYVLDLDTIKKNAGIILEKAKQNGMKVYAMTKQIGREKAAIKTLIEAGITHFVTVDIQCARAVINAGGKLGHVGHLVQIPMAEIPWMIKQEPEYWTVFSYEQAYAISKHLPKGKKQKVLARIQDENDRFYRGHEGGFNASDVLEVAMKIDKIPGLVFSGITSFPCLLYDNYEEEVYTTLNATTLNIAMYKLRNAGWKNIEVNTPGTTSSNVLHFFADKGSTQVEPGHGLTGTTPLHGVEKLPEEPAILYLSEISHFYENQAYCFGGGLYIDPVFPEYDVKCLTSDNPGEILDNPSYIEFPAINAIDYYGMIHPEKKGSIKVGDSVIMGFRAQAFVTRAYVASVSGIRSGKPVVESISYANGGEVIWP